MSDDDRSKPGPNTTAGKLVTSRNAVKHGLTAQTLLADESPREHRAFVSLIVQDLAPCGALESVIANRIGQLAWRLRRAERCEAGLFARFGEKEWEYNRTPKGVHWLGETQSRASHTDAFTKLSRYETALERAFFRAMREFERLQSLRRPANEPHGAVIDAQCAESAT